MVAGAAACTCAHCGAVCRGRFNGCPAVWARGPVSAKPAAAMEPIAAAHASLGGHHVNDVSTPDFSLAARAADTASPLPPIEPLVRPAPAPVVALEPISVRPIPAPAPVGPPAAVPRSHVALVARDTPAIRSRRFEPVPDGEGLAAIRERLDGLRNDLVSLGRALGSRTTESVPWSGDWR
jgi:hypothetical protein